MKILNRTIFQPTLENDSFTQHNKEIFEQTSWAKAYSSSSNIQPSEINQICSLMLEESVRPLQTSFSNSTRYDPFKDVSFDLDLIESNYKKFHKDLTKDDSLVSFKCFQQPNDSFVEISENCDSFPFNLSFLKYYNQAYSNHLYYNNATLVGSHNGKKVYSQYPKPLFESFENFYIADTFSEDFAAGILYNTRNIPTKTLNGRSNERLKSKFLNKHFSSSIEIKNKCFDQAFQSHVFTTYDLVTIPFETYHAQLNSQRYTSLLLPSWSAKKSGALPSFVNLTLKQTSKRVGLMVPILTKSTLLDADLEPEEVYYMSFALITDKAPPLTFLLNTCFFKPSHLKSLIEFFDLLSFKNGLFFKNRDRYFEQFSALLNTNLKIPLKKNHLPSSQTSEYTESLLKNLKNFNKYAYIPYSYFSGDSLKLLSLKPFSQKESLIKQKIDNAYTKALNQLKGNVTNATYYKSVSMLHQVVTDTLLANAQSIMIKDTKHSLFSNKHNSLLPLFITSGSAKQQYQDITDANLFKTLMEDPSKINYSESLVNLIDDNVYIESLNFRDDNNSIVSMDSLTPSEGFVKFHTRKQKFPFTLVFIIDKVLPIYVDGKISPKAVKAGGPYRVKIDAKSFSRVDLGIAPLNSKTIFASLDPGSSSTLIHPHAGALRSIEDLPKRALEKNYVNTCLGEAVSTIAASLKADRVDLSYLIFTIMVWLTSANSTDVWGQRYKYFPDYHDFDSDSIHMDDNPTVDQINHFLNSSQEDQPEETQVQETSFPQEIAPEIPVVTPENPQEYNRYINI